MQFREGILWELERTQSSLMKALEGLTEAQTAWRACASCNSIGSMVIHVGRAEDSWRQKVVGGTEIWEAEGWALRFGLPVSDWGWGYDRQPPAEKRPLSQLVRYFETTHRLFIDTVRETPPERYGEVPKHPKGLSIAQIFMHVVIEVNQHVGQIDYLKGLQNSRAA